MTVGETSEIEFLSHSKTKEHRSISVTENVFAIVFTNVYRGFPHSTKSFTEGLFFNVNVSNK